MTNEQRAEALIRQYQFDFDRIPKAEIRRLLAQEIEQYQEGSSE